MSKKYEFTDETTEVDGHTLHRIRAVRCFSDVKSGDLGGWVEKEENLSQIDDAWIGGNARAFGDAQVYDCALIYGNAAIYENAHICEHTIVRDCARIYGVSKIYGNTIVSDNAKVFENAEVCGNAKVFGNAEICGDAVVKNNEDYIVFKNFWSSGRYFTWTRSNNMWRVGCFYDTGEELIKKAYNDSERSGREYERVVRYVESIIADEKKGGEG